MICITTQSPTSPNGREKWGTPTSRSSRAPEAEHSAGKNDGEPCRADIPFDFAQGRLCPREFQRRKSGLWLVARTGRARLEPCRTQRSMTWALAPETCSLNLRV